MTSQELKIARLEREQTMLIGVIADMIDDVNILLDAVEKGELTEEQCNIVSMHHRYAMEVAENLLEGE